MVNKVVFIILLKIKHLPRYKIKFVQSHNIHSSINICIKVMFWVKFVFK